jgi:integrase
LHKKSPSMGLLYLLGVTSGLRISDLLLLTPSTTEVVEGKTGKIRQLDWSPSILALIGEYAKTSAIQRGQRLFSCCRSTVHRHIKAAASSLGLKGISAHSMRKTYAYNVLRLTRCLNTTRCALNHKYASTTVQYIIGGFYWLTDQVYPLGFKGIAPLLLQDPELQQKQTRVP